MTNLHIVTPSVEPAPTADAYAAACRALERHRRRADDAEDTLRRVDAAVDALEAEAVVDYAMTPHQLSVAEGIGRAVDRLRVALSTEETAADHV